MLTSSGVRADIELPLLLSDGAVLQRGQPIRIWGSAGAGAPVRVLFDGSQVDTIAGDDGSWTADLPAHAAGGPYALSIVAGQQTRTLHDVLVGDVWLASGQSNMELPVARAANATVEIAGANDTGIRHFKVPRSWSAEPRRQLAGGAWVSASAQTAGAFSAVAYYFARELRTHAGVPIGIIDSSWGGSRIEAWMDAGALGIDVAVVTRRMQQLQIREDQLLAGTHQRLARWQGGSSDDAAWAAAGFDDSRWAAISVPGLWEQAGYFGMDGVAWYRTQFELTSAQASQGITISLGRVDDSDRVWVNRELAGGLESQWDTRRIYRVPAAMLQAGVNVLAVRVDDQGGGGGIHGQADELYLQLADGQRRTLAGEWNFRPATVTVVAADDKNQLETLLHNSMIHPLQPYTLRGVIWYQGESNATPGLAYRYRDQFATLIRSWRDQWHDQNLPFLWVQLANFVSGADTPESSPWAVLRESQSSALALPVTAQVVAIDIGNATDIHPLGKQEIGRRLALAARALSYGESLVFSGPTYRSARFKGRAAYVEFDLHGSKELAVRGGGEAVHGFELAGSDRRFHPAQAAIRGNSIVATSDAVENPQAVRYAWRDNPQQADLVNNEYLPASPFRSNAW